MIEALNDFFWHIREKEDIRKNNSLVFFFWLRENLMFPSPLIPNQFLIPNQLNKDGGAAALESLAHDETRISQLN